MAKFALVAVLLLVAIASSTAAPVDGLDPLNFAEEKKPFEGQGMEDNPARPRFRRSLCEYIVHTGEHYDNGCNASCQNMGRVHGYCQQYNCICSQIRVKDTAVRWG